MARASTVGDKFRSPAEMLNGLRDSAKASSGVELIQQWQYMGKVHLKLLEDKVFEYCKKAGLTSVQSYVHWAEIEKEPGIMDFSAYDILVEKLTKHNLKWVPFLILGPYYATPRWFQQTDENLYARCLEHGQETKIQSIWNPNLPKYVDRFLQLVAEHYRNTNVIESIELGISGNWGESLYPAQGGFLQSEVDFHTHPGWWCGDEYAIRDFREFVSKRYDSLERLNIAWGTGFQDCEAITYPPLRPKEQSLEVRRWLAFARRCLSLMPGQTKPVIRATWEHLSTAWNIDPFDLKRAMVRSAKAEEGHAAQQWWLDFVDWYLNSMTDWAELWIQTARDHFPDTEIYLVTGGNGTPVLGADFSRQTKVAAKYRSGIRITNQNDDYKQSFIATRLVSSASRFYGAYFTTEEAGVNQPVGVTMRIFDAATSGAKGAYFKGVIGTGTDLCTGHNVPVGEPTQGAVNLARNVHHLTLDVPTIDVAVLFPNTSIALDSTILASVYEQCSRLRDVLDLDLVDETMMADGALRKYRFLLLLAGGAVRRETLKAIVCWVERGGIFITNKCFQVSDTTNSDDLSEQLCSLREGIAKIGNGYIVFFHGKGQKYREFIRQAVYNQKRQYPWIGIPVIDDQPDGIYATRFQNKVMYYNSTDARVSKRVEVSSVSQKKELKISIEPYSIASAKTAWME